MAGGGGRVGMARGFGSARAYHACVRPQWGQPTEVETGAVKAKPQLHV